METVLVERSDLARLVGLAESRARLGQAPEISQVPPAPGNRLLPVPTEAILERVLVDPDIRAYFDRSLRRGGAFSSVANPPRWPSPALSSSALPVLSQIASSTTPGEAADLAIADYVYAWGTSSQETLNPIAFRKSICAVGEGEGGAVPRLLFEASAARQRQYVKQLAANPFYCPRPAGFRPPAWIEPVVIGRGGFPLAFQVDLGKPWAHGRQVALNILNLTKVAATYPWPGVVSVRSLIWWGIELPGLRELVNQDAPLTQDMIRFWITLATVADYNRIVAEVTKWLKEKARKEKFDSLVMMVGLAAVGAILTAGVALAFTAGAAAGAGAAGGVATGTTASFTQTAVTKGLSVALGQVGTVEKEKAVEGLTDAAEQLKSTDPGFAKEAEWSAEYLRYSIALQAMEERERQEGLPPGSLRVPAPPRAPSDAPDKGWTAAVGIVLPAAFSIGSAFLRG